MCSSQLHLASSIGVAWGLRSSSDAAFAFTLARRTVLCALLSYPTCVFCVSRLTHRQITALGAFDGSWCRLSWILAGVCGFYRLRVGQVVFACCKLPVVFALHFHASLLSVIVSYYIAAPTGLGKVLSLGWWVVLRSSQVMSCARCITGAFVPACSHAFFRI